MLVLARSSQIHSDEEQPISMIDDSPAWEEYNSNQGFSDNVQTNFAGLSTMVGGSRVTPEGQSEAQLSISVTGGDNNSSSNSAVQLPAGLSMPSSSNPTDDREGGNSRRPPPRRMIFRRGNIGDPGNNNSRSVVSSSAGGASGGSRELPSVNENEGLSMPSSSNPTEDGEGGNSRRPPSRRMFFRRGNIGDLGH